MIRFLEAFEVEQLLGEARHLLSLSVEHEHRLGALASHLEGAPAVAGADGHTAGPGALGLHSVCGVSLTDQVRQLCTAAREQRLLADSMVSFLHGPADGREGSVPARVLVADDSRDTRELAATALEIAGYRVCTAGNGLEALITAHNVRPAVVLMDISMPILDGIEAARLLKAGPATRHAQVIAYTAHPGLLYGSMTRIFDEVLPKPSLPETVIASVQRLAGA